MKTYFGFAVADGMFSSNCVARREEVSVEQAKEMISGGVTPCLNPDHKSTIGVMTRKYGISVEIPEKAPFVKLGVGDRVLVMSVRGLPRGLGREYTDEEVNGATFVFGLWTVTA